MDDFEQWQADQTRQIAEEMATEREAASVAKIVFATLAILFAGFVLFLIGSEWGSITAVGVAIFAALIWANRTLCQIRDRLAEPEE